MARNNALRPDSVTEYGLNPACYSQTSDDQVFFAAEKFIVQIDTLIEIDKNGVACPVWPFTATQRTDMVQIKELELNRGRDTQADRHRNSVT